MAVTTKEGKIEAALFARVASLGLSPALPIAWPNVSFTKPAAGYLRVTHIPNMNRRRFIGSSAPHQRVGMLQIDVFGPKNKGEQTNTEIAGTIAEHFACDLLLTQDDVTVRIIKAPEIAKAMADDTHWQLPLTISYEAYA